ncbi:arabinofuranosyltransferase [Saccharopolyspora erythraea]|uniref:arabinofuranosyltransferase n=1 Tax=Saccharopolyspora erythraea TaxID=1836 RepID=UPI00201393FA|nr:arabinofuranosyltransferase [Saccharopolyspora erythraea]
MAGILPSPMLTGPSPIDEPRQDSAVRLPLRSTVVELLLGSVVAVLVSMVLQFAVVRLGISEPSFAPEALAALGAALVLTVLFGLLAFGHRRSPRWLRLGGTWVALASFTTLALAIPLQSTRFYFGGSSTDNAFRMQFMTRMASTPGLADMNYAETAPYYPGGWFWLGGRFANLLGWEGWAAYKPYALAWVAVTSVVAFTLWSIVLRRRLALPAALATTIAGMLHGIEEPYAWPSAAWMAPVAVLAWYALRREDRAPRWTLVCVGVYVGFAAITYTLHFGFAVLLIVTMAVVIGAFRVHQGQPLWPTVRRLFLRLLPIGVVSALIALLVWLPYLLSTHFLLDNPRSAAQHYLPRDSAFLPMPMTEASTLGVLCMAGLVWLLLRCRRNEVAAAMLTMVIAVYCWFGLSTLALLAKTTLLAFRLNVILGVVLATAGVLGLLELVGYLRARLDARYALRISTVAFALGLLGAVTLTQGAIGLSLKGGTDLAYEDYYPTGDNAMGHRDPEKPGYWAGAVFRTVDQLTGRPPQRNILLSTDYKMMSFRPYWGFQQETPHYANPLADYDERAAEVKRWSQARDSGELLAMLRESRFAPPNVFVLRNPSGEDTEHAGKLSVELKGDSFPQQPNVRDYQVYFDAAVFDSPEFTKRVVGPYTVIARR